MSSQKKNRLKMLDQGQLAWNALLPCVAILVLNSWPGTGLTVGASDGLGAF